MTDTYLIATQRRIELIYENCTVDASKDILDIDLGVKGMYTHLLMRYKRSEDEYDVYAAVHPSHACEPVFLLTISEYLYQQF
jgi:hypothetical protein